jgi:hypothetical protein
MREVEGRGVVYNHVTRASASGVSSKATEMGVFEI